MLGRNLYLTSAKKALGSGTLAKAPLLLREALGAGGQGAQRPGRVARPRLADGRHVVRGTRPGLPPFPEKGEGGSGLGLFRLWI